MRHFMNIITESMAATSPSSAIPDIFENVETSFADRAAQIALTFGVEAEISDIDEGDSIYNCVANLPIDLDKTLIINRFDAIEPRKGHGSRAMAQICALADQEGITLILEPWSGRTPTKILIKFYEIFDFVLDGEWMHRVPN